MSHLFCYICHDSFNCSLNRPCTLSCGHTFCFNCLKKDYIENKFITCQDCQKKEAVHYSKLSTNYAILDLLIKHIEGPIPTTKVDYNEIVEIKKEIEFTIEKEMVKKAIEQETEEDEEKEKYNSLYNFFEFMKYIIRYSDNNQSTLLNNIFTLIYKPVVFTLLLLINFYIFQHSEFGIFYMSISILYESSNSVKDISKKIKMWIAFVSFLLFEHLTWKLGIVLFENVSIVKNIFSCIRTVFIILVLGNETTLNVILSKVLNLLYYTNLILK